METPLCRIVHLSDIHAGRPSYPGIEQALLQRVNVLGADLAVVTGDLVQRAHRWQYRRAAALLEALDMPRLVVAGNHDQYSWIYRPWMRIASPLGRYKHYITRELCPIWETPSISVLGFSTATPWTIDGGRCTAAQARLLEKHFDLQPPGTFRILAVHHPLLDVRLPHRRDVADGAGKVLAAAALSGVELILCGHWHLSLVHEAVIGGRRLVEAVAGTATSGRWRKPQQGLNAFYVIDVFRQAFSIEEWRYDRREVAFAATRCKKYPRLPEI